MTEFQAGDRVRVRDVPTTGSYAGRVGQVAGVTRTPDGQALACRVKLDDGPRGGLAEGVVLFRPAELEPEAGKAP